MSRNVAIKIAGETYLLAPEHGVALELEERTEFSLFELYAKYQFGSLKLDEVALIVTLGANALLEKRLDVGAVSEHLWRLGVNSDAVRLPLGRFLLELGWSPEDAAKKFEAECAPLGKMTTTPTDIESA